MISYNQLRQNNAAFVKAQQENPVVIHTGSAYAVLGATGIYSVNINADYSISCSCSAAKHGKFCYHAAAALVTQLKEEAETDCQYAAHEEAKMRILEGAAGEGDADYIQ
jgi:hypothetical protein